MLSENAASALTTSPPLESHPGSGGARGMSRHVAVVDAAHEADNVTLEGGNDAIERPRPDAVPSGSGTVTLDRDGYQVAGPQGFDAEDHQGFVTSNGNGTAVPSGGPSPYPAPSHPSPIPSGSPSLAFGRPPSPVGSSPYAGQRALPINTNTVPMMNRPNGAAMGQDHNGSVGMSTASSFHDRPSTPLAGQYPLKELGSATAPTIRAGPPGLQPHATSSTSTVSPATPSSSALPTRLNLGPSTPGSATLAAPPGSAAAGPGQPSRPTGNLQAANTPLSLDLQAQFFQKFRMRPPQTQGQLQMFLAQRQRMAAAGTAGPGMIGMGVAAQSPKASGMVGPAGSLNGQLNGSDNGSSVVGPMGPPGQAENRAAQPPATISEPSMQGSILLNERSPMPSPQVPQERTAFPSGASPYTGNSSQDISLPNGSYPPHATPPSSVSSPVPDPPARRLSNASTSSMSSTLPLVPSHMRANMDLESMKKQMATLQQQSRQISGSSNGPGMSGLGGQNGSVMPKLANGSLMSSVLGKPFADPAGTISSPRLDSIEAMSSEPVVSRAAAAAVPADTPGTPKQPITPRTLSSPFDDQVARQQLAIMQGQQRMRDAQQQAQARLSIGPRDLPGSGQSTQAPMQSPASEVTPGANVGAAQATPTSAQGPNTAGQSRGSHPQTYVQFLGGLVRHLTNQRIPFPSGLFNFEPANPDIPGSSPTMPGYLDVCGIKLDLTRLWMTTTQAGGHARVTQQNAWDKLAQYLGFPGELQGDYALPRLVGEAEDAPLRTTRSPSEAVREVHRAYLSSFEDFYQQTRQQASQGGLAGPPRENVAGQEAGVNQKQSASSEGRRSDAQPPRAVSSEPPDSVEIGTQPSRAAHFVPSHLAIPAPAAPAVPQTAMPAPVMVEQPRHNTASNAFNNGPSLAPADLSPTSESKKRKRNSKKDAPSKASTTGRVGRPPKNPAPVGPPVGIKPDDLSRSTPAYFQDQPSNGIRPPSIARYSSPPPPKRARYRVEYQPLQRDVVTSGGWDLDGITREHAEARRHVIAAVVEDLGEVDLDGLTMSLRSRIGSEVSYALTALAMLSMPGEGDDRGGLSLRHCGDLLQDLVDLAEDAVFGEEGWEKWEESWHEADKSQGHDSAAADLSSDGRWRTSYTTLTRMAEIPDKDFTAALSCASRTLDGESLNFGRSAIQSESATFNHRRTDIALVAVNLLRNFTMMSDNYIFMSSCPEFLNLIVRVGDLRLIAAERHRPAQSGHGPAHFTLSEVIRLRRDALDVIWNLADKLDLSILPLDSSIRMFDLLGSFIFDSEQGASFAQSDDSSTLEPGRTSWLLDSALTAFARLGVTDVNRKVIRKLDPNWILELFTALSHLLPASPAAMHRTQASPLLMDMQHRLAFSLYNLAFSATTDMRRRIRTQPGTLGAMTRVIRAYAMYPDRNFNLMVASRRLTETIGVLNGPDDLDGGGRGISFGGEARRNHRRGGGDECVEAGILAHQEDLVVDLMFARPMDVSVFRELDKAVWT